ncbi:MAG: DNA primase [Holophagales bacterium]|nr:DNA primase [Holophagales bacterium]MYG32151.1 DNA primase [Holophagales bacterium]MYI80240.1 DNA primase [Holophagales bacterium]
MQGRSRLTDEAVDAVREAVDIIDLVSEHTKVERRGQRFVALCPFHKEKTPSLSLDPERKLYYCFGCGAGGDALRFHMELTGDTFATTIEHLARRYGIPLQRATGPGADGRPDRSERIQAALDAAWDFFRAKLRTEAVPQQYLQRRKVPSELITRFGVGYAPDDWRTMIEDLGRRIPVPDLESAGLIARSPKAPDRPYDRFRNRLMFPIRSPAGRLLAFGGRTLGDDQAKYVNTNETDHFRKGTLLYGLDAARRGIREQGRALLVEGYFDVLGAAASGIDWAVASMGTALTGHQVRLLSRYTDEVVLGYDGDRAGIEAARKAAGLMLETGLNVRRALFPAGQDPDSLRLDEGPEAVRATVAEARDAVAIEIDDLPSRGELDPRLRAREAARVRTLIDRVGDPIARRGYFETAAERLGVKVDVLLRESAAAAEKPAAPDSPEPAARSRPPVTSSIEEQVLRLTAAAPDLRGIEWPAPDAFFDPALRAIYEAMREQAQAGAERIDSGALVDVLGRRRGTDNETDRPVDRIAGLLLQRSSAFSESDESELRLSLAELGRRFARQRLNLLAREINRAQREGDMETLHRMIEEKQQLSRQLYRQSGR